MARILVVDDEVLNTAAAAVALEDIGHEVREASNGREAIEEMRSFVPDVVVTDYMMPIMNGVELIAAIQADDRLAQTRVILSTSVQESRVATLARYDVYLAKPYTVDSLKDAVRQVEPPA